jgi:hypothetical protein
MADLRERLHDLAGSPPALSPESIGRRVERRRTRRRLVVAGGAALAVVLVVAGATFAFVRDDPSDPSVFVGGPSTTAAPMTSTTTSSAPLVPGELPPPDTAVANPGWGRLDPGPLLPRDGYSVVWTGDEMIVWGGRVPESEPVYADGAAYDPAAQSWRVLAPAPIAGRDDHVAVWTGDEMIVWGAAGGAPNGAAYDPSTDTWRPIAPSPLDSLTVYAGVWIGDEMFVYGNTPDGAFAAAYDPVTDTWRPILTRSLRSTNSVVPIVLWTGEVVVVLDRVPGVQDLPFGLYDPESNSWREGTTDVFRAQGLGATTLDGLVYVGNYYPGHGTNPAFWARGGMATYDAEQDQWTLRAPFPVEGCEGLPTLLGLDRLLFESHCGVMALYDPATDAWTTVPTPTATTTQLAQGLVWTGRELLSWYPGIPAGTMNFHTGQPAGFWSYRP